MQGFILSLIPLSLVSSAYIIFKSIPPVVYFSIALSLYVALSFISGNSSYKNYLRYFGNDELALSDTKIYYNICMNISGNYTNLDSNRDLKDIKEIYIMGGWNPKKLVIYFNDDSHIAIHSLKDMEEVKENIEALINKQ